MHIIRTTSQNKDFIELVKLLDLDLAKRDGEEHAFYAQFHKTDEIKNAVIFYQQDIPVGCGAIKHFDAQTMEIKRMYTSCKYRGKGIASMILAELEKWAAELSYERCVLETGIRQPEAIGVYQKNGYVLMPNYGQYVGVENSRCFEKSI